MGLKVVIWFFGLVALYVAFNVVLFYAKKAQHAPYFQALAAAQAHQSAILKAGVLNSVVDLSDESERRSRVLAVMDPDARDVRGAAMTLERVTSTDRYVAMELRSAGRDAIANTADDEVVLIDFARVDGEWYQDHRTVVEQYGKRFDPKTGQPIEMPAKQSVPRVIPPPLTGG